MSARVAECEMNATSVPTGIKIAVMRAITHLLFHTTAYQADKQDLLSCTQNSGLLCLQCVGQISSSVVMAKLLSCFYYKLCKALKLGWRVVPTQVTAKATVHHIGFFSFRNATGFSFWTLRGLRRGASTARIMLLALQPIIVSSPTHLNTHCLPFRQEV